MTLKQRDYNALLHVVFSVRCDTMVWWFSLTYFTAEPPGFPDPTVSIQSRVVRVTGALLATLTHTPGVMESV